MKFSEVFEVILSLYILNEFHKLQHFRFLEKPYLGGARQINLDLDKTCKFMLSTLYLSVTLDSWPGNSIVWRIVATFVVFSLIFVSS